MSENGLAAAFPPIAKLRIPFSRDQAMLGFIAVNLIFLGVDTWLSHLTSGTIVPREWIPILFGPIAGFFALFAGWLAFKRRMAANMVASVVFLASMGVGILGTYYHWIRAILPDAAAGQQVTLTLIAWAPPVVAPLMFALIGVLGLSAAWQERPVDSGRLCLPWGKYLQMPTTKSRAYFMMTTIGMLVTVLSSVLDHSRSNFTNPFVWIPTVTGVFGLAVCFMLSIISNPTTVDTRIFFWTMILMMGVGAIGFGLHVFENLAVNNVIVVERFLRGAPLLAPLLFANIGMMGLIVLMKE